MTSSPRTRRAVLVMALAVTVLAAASCSSQPRYPSPPRSGDLVAIDIASLQADAPVFYTVMVGSRPVSFFVIRMSDGMHAYFDACVSCYQQRRGYASTDGRVVCRACNMEFSIYKLEKGIGGCNPIRLQGKTENGRFLISLSQIEAEAGRF